MDDCDRAQKHDDLYMEKLLANRPDYVLAHTGHCLNCGDSTRDKSYCDDDCQKDHIRRKQVYENQGWS